MATINNPVTITAAVTTAFIVAPLNSLHSESIARVGSRLNCRNLDSQIVAAL
jgi:hypothetical protein